MNLNEHSDRRHAVREAIRNRVDRARVRLRRKIAGRFSRVPRPVAAGALVLFGLIAGIHAATFSGSVDDRTRALRSELRQERQRAEALEGRVLGLQVETERLRIVHRYSATYSIGTDLATLIHDVARDEGLDPHLAFRLVSVESSFRRHVESHKGAVGYTQIKPSTARWLDPAVTDGELYDPETNLRLGFRYLRHLLDKYDGDRRIALLAYNKGPGRVGAQLAMGRDPANGYARSVLSTLQ